MSSRHWVRTRDWQAEHLIFSSLTHTESNLMFLSIRRERWYTTCIFSFLNREWSNGCGRIDCSESNGAKLSTPLLSAPASCQSHPTGIGTEFSHLYILEFASLQSFWILLFPVPGHTHAQTHPREVRAGFQQVLEGNSGSAVPFGAYEGGSSRCTAFVPLHRNPRFTNDCLWDRLVESCVSENGFPVVLVGHSSWLRLNYHSTKNAINAEKPQHPTGLL